MAPGGTTQFRQMSLADVAAGLRLCRASGWNQTARDWEHFLTQAPGSALVAVEKGRVIGSVAAMPYGPFTWISMILVDPAARGRGVGTQLLHEGLAHVPEGVVARLDATPAGEVLYRKLGFDQEYGLARWYLDAVPARITLRRDARPMASADWPAILEIDAHVFGASRAALLKRLAHEAPQYALVLERGGAIAGYVFGRPGHVRDHLGPLVAESHDVALLLVESWLAVPRERGVSIDVPDDQHALKDTLRGLGAGIERPFLRMYRGQLTAAGIPARVYAICGPEFG